MDARQNLRDMRKAAGLSKFRLAQLAGLGKNQLADMDEESWNPTWQTMEKIQEALKAQPESSARDGGAVTAKTG